MGQIRMVFYMVGLLLWQTLCVHIYTNGYQHSSTTWDLFLGYMESFSEDGALLTFSLLHVCMWCQLLSLTGMHR